MSKLYDQLIQTSEALFIQHGMKRVTVEEICTQANVSKPTFYKYFQNKEAIARRIVELWIEDILQRIDEIEEREIPFSEKMKLILEMKLELSARPGPEFTKDLLPLSIDFSSGYQRVMEFFIASQGKGDIREDIRPEVLLAAFTVLHQLIKDPKIRSLYSNPESISGDVFKLFYYGALSASQREFNLMTDNTNSAHE